ncbi:hypothetical protein BKA80DRAFT_303387 [Phyllosticta citrichinensis]
MLLAISPAGPELGKFPQQSWRMHFDTDARCVLPSCLCLPVEIFPRLSTQHQQHNHAQAIMPTIPPRPRKDEFHGGSSPPHQPNSNKRGGDHALEDERKRERQHKKRKDFTAIGATASVPVTGAAENTRAAGAFPGRDQRRSNAPQQDEHQGRLPHGQADLARQHSQERYNRLAAWMDNNDFQTGELEQAVTAQAKSIRNIRHELEQQRQQHAREIVELQRQRQEEVEQRKEQQQQQAHEISRLQEQLERLEQQQQEHGQDMFNLQEGVQDALPYLLMQQRQQQQQQVQRREDKDRGEDCEPTLGSPILIE